MTEQREKQHLEAQQGPWIAELVEGEPLQVAGRELVPLVRVTSRVQRRASLYDNEVTAQGFGLIHMRPVAILDRGEGGRFAQERHQIRHETARIIGWLVLAALLIPCLATLLVYLSRRLDDGYSERASA